MIVRVFIYLPVLVLYCLVAILHADTAGAKNNKDAVEDEGAATAEVSRILALSDDVEYGEYLAGECASCHLEKALSESSVPVIHGEDPAYLVKALLEFRSGVRTNSTMALVANGMGDEEMAAIVHYLAAAKP